MTQTPLHSAFCFHSPSSHLLLLLLLCASFAAAAFHSQSSLGFSFSSSRSLHSLSTSHSRLHSLPVHPFGTWSSLEFILNYISSSSDHPDRERMMKERRDESESCLPEKKRGFGDVSSFLSSSYSTFPFYFLSFFMLLKFLSWIFLF